MASQLDSLQKYSKIVADTGDLTAIKKFKPLDATTNPSLILKAFPLPEYQDLITRTIQEAKKEVDEKDFLGHAVDRLAVAMGTEISRSIPGHVSTEVAARLSYDKAASIAKAKKLIALYAQNGIGKDRVLIKVASTWEGIEAARALKSEGINCNLTLLFSEAQARACFEAGVFLISPFVGRVTDWYKKETGQTYTPENDPGVLFVRKVAQIAASHQYQTIVMGASFRNTGQILALAGLDRLTIAPEFLEEMASTTGDVTPQIKHEAKAEAKREPLNESEFRWLHAEDAMANDKLAEGIRRFAQDQEKLEQLIKARSN